MVWYISRVPVDFPSKSSVSSGILNPSRKQWKNKRFTNERLRKRYHLKENSGKTKVWRLFQMIPFRQAQRGKGIISRNTYENLGKTMVSPWIRSLRFETMLKRYHLKENSGKQRVGACFKWYLLPMQGARLLYELSDRKNKRTISVLCLEETHNGSAFRILEGNPIRTWKQFTCKVLVNWWKIGKE